MMDKLFNALSLSQKAGKLVIGFDATINSVFRGDAKLVCFAKDLSPRSKKRAEQEIQKMCEIYTLPYSQQELAAITRKPVGILTITDAGLSQLFKNALPSIKGKEENI